MTIALIGGGIYGTAIASFLAERDVDDVTLFETDAIGGIATSRSVGIIRHHYCHAQQVRVAKRGRELLDALADEVDIGYHRNGYIAAAGPENEALFRENIERQREVGVEVELLSPDALEARFPAATGDGLVAAAYEPRGGFADPYLAATAYADRARLAGASIHANTEVTDIDVRDGRAVALETTAGRVDVDVVVNAAGPLAKEVAALAGVDIPLARYEAKELVLRSGTDYEPDLPTFSDLDTGLYTKPESAGDFVAGGVGVTEDRSTLDTVHDLEGVTNADLLEMMDLLEGRLPGFADAEVLDTWSGVITAPPDWHQLVGFTPEVENLYLACGGSGHGFKEAPGFAESIAQVLAGEDPRLDLSRYRPERFVEGEMFDRAYADASWG